jgi:biopolymer transport protein ExbD
MIREKNKQTNKQTITTRATKDWNYGSVVKVLAVVGDSGSVSSTHLATHNHL